MPPEHSRTMTGPRERISAGGVVVRTDAGAQVCLIRPAGRRVWGLPKGGVETGETLAQAAVREVAEETGISGVVDDALGSIDYSFYSREQNGRIHKTVHYYLMHATGGDTADHDHEVSEARWVGLREALRLMTYPNEREMVRRAAAALGEALDP
jgi:8-oxo-dGTP pyrophosphatase MutT (NUDIX family)